jgi:hypothetical protein
MQAALFCIMAEKGKNMWIWWMLGLAGAAGVAYLMSKKSATPAQAPGWVAGAGGATASGTANPPTTSTPSTLNPPPAINGGVMSGDTLGPSGTNVFSGPNGTNIRSSPQVQSGFFGIGSNIAFPQNNPGFFLGTIVTTVPDQNGATDPNGNVYNWYQIQVPASLVPELGSTSPYYVRIDTDIIVK